MCDSLYKTRRARPTHTMPPQTQQPRLAGCFTHQARCRAPGAANATPGTRPSEKAAGPPQENPVSNPGADPKAGGRSTALGDGRQSRCHRPGRGSKPARRGMLAHKRYKLKRSPRLLGWFLPYSSPGGRRPHEEGLLLQVDSSCGSASHSSLLTCLTTPSAIGIYAARTSPFPRRFASCGWGAESPQFV